MLLGHAAIVAFSGHKVPGVNGEQSGSSSLKLAAECSFKVAPRGKDLWGSLRRSPPTPWNWATTRWPRSCSEVPLRPELRSWVNMFTDAWALPVLLQRVEAQGRAGGQPARAPSTHCTQSENPKTTGIPGTLDRQTQVKLVWLRWCPAWVVSPWGDDCLLVV